MEQRYEVTHHKTAAGEAQMVDFDLGFQVSVRRADGKCAGTTRCFEPEQAQEARQQFDNACKHLDLMGAHVERLNKEMATVMSAVDLW